jgi:hypothetical protein
MSAQVAAAAPLGDPIAVALAGGPAADPPALELLRGVPYLGHAQSDGAATVRILHHGVDHALRGTTLRIHGDPAPGATVAILRVNQELRMVVLQ